MFVVIVTMLARRISIVRSLRRRTGAALRSTATELLRHEAGKRQESDPSSHEPFLNDHGNYRQAG